MNPADGGAPGTRWILAVDLGNGGPKVAAVGLDGTLLGTASRPVGTRVERDGTAVQDPGEWWRGLVAAVPEAVAAAGVSPSGLHAVGLTGNWCSTVPVGADGHPVGDVLLWADTRARDLSARVIGGRLAVNGLSPARALPFIRLTGAAPTPSGADPTGHSLLLRERFPEQYARTRWLMEPLDYLGLRLTGRAAATPASMVMSWLTDNRIPRNRPDGNGSRPTVHYHDGLVRRTGRDAGRLPELLPTGSVLGPLLPEVAAEFGLSGGAPVICSIPDLHAAVIGSGAVAPYQTHLAVSTTQWFSARVPFKRTDAVHSIASVPGLDSRHHVVADNQEIGAGALSWLTERLLAPGEHAGLADLVALAGQAPVGSEGVLFLPWLAGERSPVDDKQARGAWINLSLRTDRAIMVRSVLEGVALNARWLFGPYQRFLRRPVESVRILGGGAQSGEWCQIYADVLDRPVEQVADPRHAQLRGIALWTRVCLGELALDDVPALVPVAARYLPRPGAVAVYDRLFAEFRGMHGRLKGTFHRLNA